MGGAAGGFEGGIEGEADIKNLTFLIDESGEAGISKIRSSKSGGASPYMTLGGVLLETDQLEKYRSYVETIRQHVGKKSLHCNQLRHFQKVYFAKRVAEIPPLHCFGVISRKETLGWYKNTIDDDSSAYYNKCAQFLLERVGHFMKANEILPHKLEIIFERGNFNYRKLKNLIKTCQDTPIGRTKQQINEIKLLRQIDAENIRDTPKDEEPLLQLADLVAHALYRCVDKTKGG